MELKNKVVIITGGANGIGLAMANRFSKEGAEVIIADISARKAVSSAKKINGYGLACDVTNEADIIRLVKIILSRYGRIDLFVSNAGVCFGEKNHSASASNDDWEKSWQVNLMAHVYAARATLPEMIKQKNGYFLQVISAAALLTLIGDAAYSATKSAALSFAESLAISHMDDGIRVSAVCPQYVATEMLGYSKVRKEGLSTGLLSPDQVAEKVVNGLRAETFLILPHPEVRKFMQFKLRSYDKWLVGMNQLRKKVLEQTGDLDIRNLHKVN